MIINFSVENWRSFKNKASLSMLATREKQHKHRVPYISKYGINILPIASVYGGNASGKSNFFQALDTLKLIIVEGIEPKNAIPVDPFFLDSGYTNEATSFEIEILIDEVIYKYRVSATRKEILEEKLIEVSSEAEFIVYERNNQIIKLGDDKFQNERLKLIIDGNMTRRNQTFLNLAINLNFEPFFNIWNFFNKITIISPHSKYLATENLLEERSNKSINNMLSKLDTGISRIGGENIDINSLSLSSERREAVSNLSEGKLLRIGRIVIKRKDGNLVAQRLVSYHRRIDDSEVYFGLDMESDGSQRALDILPAIVDLQYCDKIFVIDEIDRSLHTALTGTFIEEYLNNCSENKRAQLLMTTHDTQLMTQDIFRRDEIWFTERQNDGSSDLFSLAEFDIRADLDIRKNYLQGRFGGIPNIAMHHRCKKEASSSEEI
jgi:AAA15 family ATPase/GTPase